MFGTDLFRRIGLSECCRKHSQKNKPEQNDTAHGKCSESNCSGLLVAEKESRDDHPEECHRINRKAECFDEVVYGLPRVRIRVAPKPPLPTASVCILSMELLQDTTRNRTISGLKNYKTPEAIDRKNRHQSDAEDGTHSVRPNDQYSDGGHETRRWQSR
jgi:hypothetical protein